MPEDSNVSILVSRRSLFQICGKVIIASHTELPFKASMNNCLCFDYVKKSTLCEYNVEEGLIDNLNRLMLSCNKSPIFNI